MSASLIFQNIESGGEIDVYVLNYPQPANVKGVPANSNTGVPLSNTSQNPVKFTSDGSWMIGSWTYVRVKKTFGASPAATNVVLHYQIPK